MVDTTKNPINHDKLRYFILLHKKWSFPWRIYSANMTKSAGNCRFGHIYWRNPSWKTSFFGQCLLLNDKLKFLQSSSALNQAPEHFGCFRCICYYWQILSHFYFRLSTSRNFPKNNVKINHLSEQIYWTCQYMVCYQVELLFQKKILNNYC